jgi:hypothetical protein
VKILKGVIGSLVALGAYGLPSIANAQFCVPSGVNTICNPRHPAAIVELHASTSGGSGSLAAAAVMGAEGFSNAAPPPSFEVFITSGCAAKTKEITGPATGTCTGRPSVWPSICNPDGMALFLNEFSPPNPPGQPPVSWVTFKTADQTLANRELIRGFRDFGSPGLIPVYGQADHWVAVTQVIFNTATGNVVAVRAFDGGKSGDIDSGFNSYFTGLQSWGTTAWLNTFFKVVTAINPCCDAAPGGGCGAAPVLDPFANRYVVMYEPPPAITNSSFAPVVFAPNAGIVGKGMMTASVAQSRVMDSLVAGGVSSDAAMWGAFKGGSPGAAFLVHAVWPSGAPWTYYLVPILSSTNANTVVAFALVDGADGSFHNASVLATPQAFAPLSMTRARELAARTLVLGETLTGGVLTFNPRTLTGFAKSPIAPYYEFGVSGTKGGTVRVQLHGGAVLRK